MASSTLQRYLVAFNKYKWFALLSMALTMTGAIFYASNQGQPVQEFEATGMLVPNQAPGVFSETGLQFQNTELLPSTENLVSEDIKISLAELVQIPLEELEEKLDVREEEPDEEARLPLRIVATYMSPNEIEAEAVMDALLPLVVQRSLEINAATLQSRVEAIEERLPEVEQELREAEQRLEAFNRQEEVDILAAQTGGLVDGIVQSQQQQRVLSLELAGTNAQIRSLEERLGLNVSEAFLSSALSSDPIIAQLRTQILEAESSIAILRQSLRPTHPQVVALGDQLNALEGLLKARATEVTQGGGELAPLVQGANAVKIRQDSSLDPTRQQLANTLVALQTQQETLQRQLSAATQVEQELRQQYETIPNRQLEQGRLAQVVALKKGLYDRIQAALIDAQAAQAETIPSVRIAQFTEVSPLPLEQALQPPVILLLGAIIGVVLGTGVIFILSTFEGRLYTRDELEDLLRQEGAPFLGTLPVMSSEANASQLIGRQPTLPLLLNENSAYLNAYEQLRSKIARSGGGKGARVVLVTSPGKSEGKSLVAYNLAIANARSGKRTLLIEADLRHASQLSDVGLNNIIEGLTEPLQFYDSAGQCIQMVPAVENLYAVASTGPQSQPASVLESDEIRRLFQDARGRFDMVIVDSSSFLWYNDSLLLEPLIDGVLLVTRPEQTQRVVLEETMKLLEETQTPFIGAVINASKSAIAGPPTGSRTAMGSGTVDFEATPGYTTFPN